MPLWRKILLTADETRLQTTHLSFHHPPVSQLSCWKALAHFKQRSWDLGSRPVLSSTRKPALQGLRRHLLGPGVSVFSKLPSWN